MQHPLHTLLAVTLAACCSAAAAMSTAPINEAGFRYGAAGDPAPHQILSDDGTAIVVDQVIEVDGLPYTVAGRVQSSHGSLKGQATTQGDGPSGSAGDAWTYLTDSLSIHGGTGSASGRLYFTVSAGSMVESSTNISDATAAAQLFVVANGTNSTMGTITLFSQHGSEQSIQGHCFFNDPACAFDPVTRTLVAPLEFRYDADIYLQLQSSMFAEMGGAFTVAASIRFELPDGATLTSSSGATYAVSHVSDVPEPASAASTALGLVLLTRVCARRRRASVVTPA